MNDGVALKTYAQTILILNAAHQTALFEKDIFKCRGPMNTLVHETKTKWVFLSRSNISLIYAVMARPQSGHDLPLWHVQCLRKRDFKERV